MNRATRRQFQRDFAKMPKEDNCSLCGKPFEHNSRTYGGFTAAGAIAHTGRCCAGTLTEVLTEGVYASRNFGELRQLNANKNKVSASPSDMQSTLDKVQSHFSALDEISNKVANQAGLHTRSSEIYTSETSWKSDDAAWFKINPSRSHRMRPVFNEEASTLPTAVVNVDIPENHRLEILVRQVQPGMRVRTIFCRNMDFDIPDSEEIIHALFDLVTQRSRENKILNVEEVAALATSYRVKSTGNPN